MQLVVNVNTSTEPVEVIARRAERAGADAVWVPEAYGHEAIARLGYLAAVTERVRLGTAIVNVYSRAPALLAQAAVTLDELSHGRFELGIGTSGPQVVEGWYGIPFDQPVDRLADTIEVCRRVWRREKLTYEGSTVRLPLPADQGRGAGKALHLLPSPIRPSIPIWVGGMGPRTVALVASRAEGWYPLFFPLIGPTAPAWSSALEAGLARRPAALGPLQVCAGGVVVVSDDESLLAEGRRLATERIAHYIGRMGSADLNFYRDLVQRLGYAEEALEVQRRMLGGDVAGAVRAVPAELVEAVSICVPTSQAGEVIHQAADRGVTHLRVDAVCPDWQDSIGVLRDAIASATA